MRYGISVRGQRDEWLVFVPEAQAKAMREDGFEVMEIANSVPEWAMDVGLGWLWCAVQDLWGWPSRWGKR